jgi:hypothetical protein
MVFAIGRYPVKLSILYDKDKAGTIISNIITGISPEAAGSNASGEAITGKAQIWGCGPGWRRLRINT